VLTTIGSVVLTVVATVLTSQVAVRGYFEREDGIDLGSRQKKWNGVFLLLLGGVAIPAIWGILVAVFPPDSIKPILITGLTTLVISVPWMVISTAAYADDVRKVRERTDVYGPNPS